MKTLLARDLSPLEGLTRADEEWLERLVRRVSASEHVVRLGAAAEDPEPIVSCAYDGRWRAGRYIGSVAFDGRRLEIHPRLAPEALRDLLGTALNLVIPVRSARLERATAAVPLLLALVWCRELDTATRHGLPFLRLPARQEGLFVRGRIDERRTQELRRQAIPAVGSVAPQRSLENDIARTIVCGQRALARMLGGDAWMTPRAADVMPHLWAAVGPRPRLPSAAAVRRIRYTPIRLPYRALVGLSWELARGQGLRGAGEGNAEGLLIDMAEVWERFVLACARRANASSEDVAHEALEGSRERYLYRSMGTPDVSMGRLLPDVVVRRGGLPVAILDAKYKLVSNRPEAPFGVARGDRYQLAGYLSAFERPGLVGALAYPAEVDEHGRELHPERQSESGAESQGPWQGPGASTAYFRRISFQPDLAARQLGGLFAVSSGGVAPDSRDAEHARNLPIRGRT